MLATLLGPPELDAPGVAVPPPQAASVKATTTRVTGKRFMLSSPSVFGTRNEDAARIVGECLQRQGRASRSIVPKIAAAAASQ